MNRTRIIVGLIILFIVLPVSAASFGDVRGRVRDPQQRPIKDVKVTLKSKSSDFSRTTQTDDQGEFSFRAVPLGDYTVTAESSGFGKLEQSLTVISDSAPVLQFQLQVAPVSQQIEVVGSPSTVGSDSATPISTVNREQISQTPGADRTNSLAVILDYMPGAYTAHNQLHVRGGHQVTWLIDGIPVPNTNIADTVGAQFDPKDIDYLEMQRGSYSAEYGDRTYGVFNVIPRTGFERNREGEFLASYGNFNQTNDQVSFGSHTERFAYYFSLNGNRSDYGLQTPTADVIHDQSSGFGGFASLIYNPTSNDQLRLVTSTRNDHYQVPNAPADQAAGIRDIEKEADSFINFTWAHTFGSGFLFTASPFYHFNRADFVGGPNDTPISARDKRTSNYAGAQVTISQLTRHHNAKAGFYGFHQSDSSLFGLQANDGSGLSLQQQEHITGSLTAFFLEDQYKPTDWLTLTGGLRLTHFSGSLTENDTSPRAGVAVKVPRLQWTVRGFYGRYYQAPPLSTVSGPLLNLVLANGFDFLPLRGERDEEYQAGIAIPIKGWLIDTDYFHTSVKNFFDHNALNNSNIFFPLTIERARIRGWETTIRSPRFLAHRAQISLAYSNQKAEGQGTINGGLTDFSFSPDFFLLDHDQRHTLSTVINVTLPMQSYAAGVIRYGSGFADDGGPGHLPGHTTFDLSLGKNFRERWSLAVHAINMANNRFLLDNSNTFGGSHFVEPRQVYFEMRYRFHY